MEEFYNSLETKLLLDLQNNKKKLLKEFDDHIEKIIESFEKIEKYEKDSSSKENLKDDSGYQTLLSNQISLISEVEEIKTSLNSETLKLQDILTIDKKKLKFCFKTIVNTAAKCLFNNNSGFISTLEWEEKGVKDKPVKLSNDNTIYNGVYNGCYNSIYANYVFNSCDEERFSVLVTNNNSEFTHHYIGFVNEMFYNNPSCHCLYKEGVIYLHEKGFLKKKTDFLCRDTRLQMDDNQPKLYTFAVRANDNEFDFIIDDEVIYTAELEGSNFRFFVGKCNSGNYTYEFVNN